MRTATRHGLAALVVLAVVAPLMPAEGNAMACCRGTGRACACPLELGFSRCAAAAPVSVPETPPALLPPGPPVLTLSAFPETPAPSSEALARLSRRPQVPPPRSSDSLSLRERVGVRG